MESQRSIAQAIETHAVLQSDALALLAPGRGTCNYAASNAHVDRTTSILQAYLPPPNRVIAIALANGPDVPTALVAAMSARVCAPVDVARASDEIDAFLAEVRPAVAITDPESTRRHGARFEHYGVRILCISAGRYGEAGVFDLTSQPSTGTPGVRLSTRRRTPSCCAERPARRRRREWCRTRWRGSCTSTTRS